MLLRGFIPLEKLKFILLSMGETDETEEDYENKVKQLQNENIINHGEFDYAKFATELFKKKKFESFTS